MFRKFLSLHGPTVRRIGTMMLVLWALPALADNSRWYGGRSDGQWQLVTGNASTLSTLSRLGLSHSTASSEGQSAVRFFGGYQLNDLLSVEGAHTSLGLAPDGCFNNNSTAALQDACLGNAISMSAVSNVPVGDVWKMYGRMGLHAWQPGAPTLKWGTLGHASGEYGHVYGLGLSYTPMQNVTLRMESERYTHITSLDSGAEADGGAQVQSVTLSVHF